MGCTMKSTMSGLVIVICLLNFKLLRAHENRHRESITNLAGPARSLWATIDYNDIDEYDYDDGDDDAEEFDGLDRKEGASRPPGDWGKGNNAPSGVLSKRENQPPGVWGKRSNQPPGVWGKRSYQPRKSYKSNIEGRKDDMGDRKSLSTHVPKAKATKESGKVFGNEEILTVARYLEKKRALEKRKLALFDTIRRLKNTLDNDE